MPTSGGYTVLRSWSATTTDAAPTASSTFVTPTFFPGANSVEIAFTELTKGATSTGEVELWLRTTDASGTTRVIPYDTSAGTIATGSTSQVLTSVQLTDVPPGDWYARIKIGTASTGFTGTALIRYFSNNP